MISVNLETVFNGILQDFIPSFFVVFLTTWVNTYNKFLPNMLMYSTEISNTILNEIFRIQDRIMGLN